MSTVLSQCFCVKCESRYIAMKSETSAKHLRGSLKETRLHSGKHDKKIKIYPNITRMVLHFYKNYFNMLVDQWFSKFESYISLSRLCHSPKVYRKGFLRKIPFCY